MKKKWSFLMLLGILNFTGIFSQASFKVMFYNVLNFPLEDAVPNRLFHLQTILMDYQPDVFMVCELNNEAGAIRILQVFQERVSINFEMATFQSNTSDDTIGDSNNLQNMLFYDSSKFSLESQTIIPTIYRDFNHYRLKLKTLDQEENPIYLDAIVCHLKASSGENNEALRLQMVTDLNTYLSTFPTDRHVILAGDFNVYSSSEPAFQALISLQNNITFTDPANKIGSWHNNTSYADVFTQSTRTRSDFGGSTGGLDDRFDFIMTSETMLQTNSDLFFEPDTYQVYGNNGRVACFNQSIISSDCAGSLFSLETREALHFFSDHLPVTMQISTTATLSVPEFIVTQSNPIEIVGSNYIQNTLNLKVNTLHQGSDKLFIYNSLGQQINSIAIKAGQTYNVSLTNLSVGIYYIVTSKTHVKPLKFIKTP